MKRIRTFVAVDLAPSVTAAAGGLIDRLRQKLDPVHAEVHWVDPRLMHVTVKFLGDVDEAELPSVCRGVEVASRGVSAFQLECWGLGVFPRPERPRTVWLGIDPAGTDSLQQVHAQVENQMMGLGFMRENRRYAPHVTLGRVRGAAHWRELTEVLRAHATFHAGRTLVEELTVYASRLARGGPTYMPLARVALS